MSKYDWLDKLESSGVSYSFWNNMVIPMVHAVKGGVCEHCGSADFLDVHHTSYVVQNIHTLLLLCRSCHKNWHKNHVVEVSRR